MGFVVFLIFVAAGMGALVLLAFCFGLTRTTELAWRLCVFFCLESLHPRARDSSSYEMKRAFIFWQNHAPSEKMILQVH